jgi:hypothetical protein
MLVPCWSEVGKIEKARNRRSVEHKAKKKASGTYWDGKKGIFLNETLVDSYFFKKISCTNVTQGCLKSIF